MHQATVVLLDYNDPIRVGVTNAVSGIMKVSVSAFSTRRLRADLSSFSPFFFLLQIQTMCIIATGPFPLIFARKGSDFTLTSLVLLPSLLPVVAIFPPLIAAFVMEDLELGDVQNTVDMKDLAGNKVGLSPFHPSTRRRLRADLPRFHNPFRSTPSESETSPPPPRPRGSKDPLSLILLLRSLIL